MFFLSQEERFDAFRETVSECLLILDAFTCCQSESSSSSSHSAWTVDLHFDSALKTLSSIDFRVLLLDTVCVFCLSLIGV